MTEIRTAGNAEVIELFEYYLAEAKSNPKIGYAALIYIEAGTKEAKGGFGGDVILEPRAERGAQALAGNIRERIINRILPPRDANVPADYACYNLPAASISYDFLIWLIDAEMQRIREGAPPPLKVHFWYGRDGKAGLYLPAQQQMFERVVKPSLALIGAIEHPDAAHGRDYAQRHMRMITAQAQEGAKVPRFKAPVRAREAMRRWLGDTAPVTITLREADHWPHRNSNFQAWREFGRDLIKNGERVVFVRDTAKAQEQMIDGFITCPQASTDLHARMALYEQAKANLFVANGPCTLAAFSDRPWLTFTTVEPDDSAYRANTPAFWRMHIGIDVGEQYPWSAPDQRIVWQADTYENITAAWRQLFADRPDALRLRAG